MTETVKYRNTGTGKKKIFLLPVLVFIFSHAAAQTAADTTVTASMTDTTTALKEVQIVSLYPGKPSWLRSPGSISILKSTQLARQPEYSLVPAMNTVPGVRMEERSPGSYRLSLRGSLIRSPFGIRNVKVYMDEFPLTDAGGNTYLNLLDPSDIKGVEVLKGPDGSLFGANTGGVVLLKMLPEQTDSTVVSAALSAGSYNLLNENVSYDQQWKKYRLNISESFQKNDGYRENSALQRFSIKTIQQFDYRPESHVKIIALYSNLQYETPGGLTLGQFELAPQMARPATATLPGASEQKAGISNQTFFAGISNEIAILHNLKHVITLFGSHTDFENPFITNYEVRNENTFGARTYFELSGNRNPVLTWKWNIGLEAEAAQAGIDNYGNNGGVKDGLQTSDNIDVQQGFAFTQFSLDLNNRWIVEAALSVNNYQYRYKNRFPAEEPSYTRQNLDLQYLPRLAGSYRITKNMAWRVSASKGYSAPTVAEIRPSDNTIYENLQAEYGWNYETGFRFNSDRFEADVTAFNFQLQHTIVRRVNDDGREYFINSGKTNQQGIELRLSVLLVKPNSAMFVRGLQLSNSSTFYDFRFVDYVATTADYSGNRITGIPQYTSVTNAELNLPLNFYLFGQYSYTGQLPLNDANDAYAKEYHLVQVKAGWKLIRKWQLEVFAGIDNLLNTKYSLGNDINAAGGRYYNAAPPRNYYVGMKTRF